MTRFVWYWTFWHWSKESFRSGALLHSPLQGIGSHWDEWFRHEAAEGDLRAIAEAGRNEGTQREFIAWLYRHWATEMEWRDNRMAPRFVLSQLASLPPFNQWVAFEEYRGGTRRRGVSALVLAEGSSGHSSDVRNVEGLALPADRATAGSKVLTENFHADREDLETPRQAAMSLLRGKGLFLFLALWALGGERPYPRWLKAGLNAGWAGVAGLILYLLAGPEPDERLFALAAILTGLWGALTLTAVTMTVTQGWMAWRAGHFWRRELERGQIRFEMPGGLTLQGGSAGLAFCLNTLLALHRAWPLAARRSWLWGRVFRAMRTEGPAWAATGVITADGFLKPVIIDSKIRACLEHAAIERLITPRQRNASRSGVHRAAKEVSPTARRAGGIGGADGGGGAAGICGGETKFADSRVPACGAGAAGDGALFQRRADGDECGGDCGQHDDVDGGV